MFLKTDGREKRVHQERNSKPGEGGEVTLRSTIELREAG